MASDGYLSLKEAAKYLGVSDTKVRRLISKGLLKVSFDPLDDRKRLVKKSDLDGLRTPRAVDSVPNDQKQKEPRTLSDNKKKSSVDKGNVSDEP